MKEIKENNIVHILPSFTKPKIIKAKSTFCFIFNPSNEAISIDRFSIVYTSLKLNANGSISQKFVSTFQDFLQKNQYSLI